MAILTLRCPLSPSWVYFHPAHKFLPTCCRSLSLDWNLFFTKIRMEVCISASHQYLFGAMTKLVLLPVRWSSLSPWLKDLTNWVFYLLSSSCGFSLAKPWLVWLSGLSTDLRTERSPVQVPVRGQARVADQVPGLDA